MVLNRCRTNCTKRNTKSKFREESKGVVYGQDEAIENIVDKILVAQAGLNPDDKTVGSFVFMGPLAQEN